MKLKYKQSLRGLEDEEEELVAECKKREKKGEKKTRFKCKFNIKNKKINNIEVQEDKFDFIDQEVTIKLCTPLAVKYLKKLQTVGKEEKFRKKVFLLENAELKEDEKEFTIIGKIKDRSFDNDEVTLTVFNNKKNRGINIECSVKKKGRNYNIVCKPEKNIKGYLDGAFGDFGEEFLVIKFKDDQDSEIDFVAKKEDKDKDEDKKEDKDEDKKEDKDEDKKEDKDEDKKKNKKKKKKEDKDDDKDEDKKEEKKDNNDDNDDEEKKPKKKKVIIKKQKTEAEDDTDSTEEENWWNNNNILIYIIIGSLFFLLIVLVCCRFCKVQAQPAKIKSLESSSMDKVKFASQGSDS